MAEISGRIKSNDYTIPSRISSSAQRLIRITLEIDPAKRPNMCDVIDHEFFKCGYIPPALPVTSLTGAPRSMFNAVSTRIRRVFRELVGNVGDTGHVGDHQLREGIPKDCWLREVYVQLDDIVDAVKHLKFQPNNDNAEDRKKSSGVWVVKWVDYSNKWGLGYQLSDGSVGVVFNDGVKLCLLPDEESVYQIDKTGLETCFPLKERPEHMQKWVQLLLNYKEYMKNFRAGVRGDGNPETDATQPPVVIKAWFRTKHAMTMHMTNGNLQMNFLHDHNKLVCCPSSRAILFISPDGSTKTLSMDTIQKLGCTKDLHSRIVAARDACRRMMAGPTRSSGQLKA